MLGFPLAFLLDASEKKTNIPENANNKHKICGVVIFSPRIKQPNRAVIKG